MKTTLKAIVIGTALGITGCSHAAIDRRIDEKLASEPTTMHRAEVSQEASALIENLPGLTTEQRAKLGILHAKMQSEMADLGQSSLKLRSLLVQELISKTYDRDEVDHIKKRLRDVENRKISAIFNGVDEANKILGRQDEVNRRLYEDFLGDMRDGHFD